MKKVYMVDEEELRQIHKCIYEITNESKAIIKRMDLDADKGTVNYFVECLLKSNFELERILDSCKL